MKAKVFIAKLLFALLVMKVSSAQEISLDSLLQMPFEEVLKIKVEASSGMNEALLDAAASMIVISETEIQQRGYTNLAEIFYDLPGFDISKSNSESYITLYQRGYRTSKTQRTLFLINGKVDNHLWMHEAQISRQYPIGMIKQIEVLYGPTSAVHGANAFLGVINIVTKDGSDLNDGEMTMSSSVQIGSWNTKGVDLFLSGKSNELRYSLAGRLFKSDEPDLSKQWGMCSEERLSDRNVWGPILDRRSRNIQFGKYTDPSENYGFVGDFYFQGLNVGFLHWKTKEGYGSHYPGDIAQVNGGWENNSTQIYAEFEKEIQKGLTSKSLLLYRKNFVGGDFAEAIVDWNDPTYSYVSHTNWSSLNNSVLFRQEIQYNVGEKLNLSGGIKFERKELTKAYDIPGYWGAYASTIYLPTDTGLYTFGLGIAHSTDEVYYPAPHPAHKMPHDNMALTEDVGGFIQMIYNLDRFRFNLGVRYDENSIYGSSINPRLSVIFKPNDKGALKLTYGEAFQEPAPLNLWGGWSGRRSNPDLKPEKARNIELIWMYNMDFLLHDISTYYAHYENVIKEEAENAGTRYVYGFEYRLKYQFPNPIPNSPRICCYANYSYTVSKSSIYFNHSPGENLAPRWEKGETDLGDIAPHKVQLGVNLPVTKYFNLNLRGLYVSERELYSRNVMRPQGKIDDYSLLNGTVSFKYNNWLLSLKVENIFDHEYLHPGIEQADAGNDTSKRAPAFHNSMLPQAKRNFLVNLTFKL